MLSIVVATVNHGIRRAILCLTLLCGSSATLCNAVQDDYLNEAAPARDGRMAWWREARFGMFIHWGLYAIPAGHWGGNAHEGVGEWIMNTADIPVDRYEKLAEQFHPVRYDPRQWVQIAKQAGMKYIVITSKHHDGFCLFDTAATDWDVVSRTPYQKDLLAPLAEQCRKAGLKFCVYYSIMDWHHPAQMHGETHYNPTLIKPARKPEYVDFMKQQIAELVETCDPDILWFDGEWVEWWTESDGKDLYNYVRSLKPEMIINNRVGKGRKGMEGLTKDDQQYAGDFGTPEQEIPATGLPGVDWESCMTMNDTWGYKRDDKNWKSSPALIRNLIDIASKGGNYLLNVGPTAEGEIPAASMERLAEIGRWMELNGESIYGTEASPFATLSWGRCTQKPGKLYLHSFELPPDGVLRLPAIKNQVHGASLLAVKNSELPVTHLPDGLEINLSDAPEVPLAEQASVVVLEIDGPVELVNEPE